MTYTPRTPKLGDPLTDRELSVLRHVAEGLENAEIGRAMYLSVDTIKTHLRRLTRKLGAHNRAHAVALGYRQNLLIPGYERVA